MNISVWISLGSLVVALSGVAIGIIGYRSNATAIRREQTDRQEQLDAFWASEWAAQRPVVFPVLLPEWTSRRPNGRYHSNSHLIPLKNGGRGPALNVRGRVSVSAGGGRAHRCGVVAGPIAPGDLLDAQMATVPPNAWTEIRGVLEYQDLVDKCYETVFEFTRGHGGEPLLKVELRDKQVPESGKPRGHSTPAD